MNPSVVAGTLTKRLECSNCQSVFPALDMLNACSSCSGPLRYVVNGRWDPDGRTDPGTLWKYLDLLPLGSAANVVSMGEGGSPVIELPELADSLGGARLFLKLDSMKNPTGTFKDREASLVVSRCKELGLDNLVFYSTSNTGRAYMHYAAAAGLTTFLFVPQECRYKLTTASGKGPTNYLITVEGEYPQIAPYAKRFAADNGLTLIAPLHERTEAYATLAYEQIDNLPDCDVFAQTIASGMGPIGFLRGHQHMVRLGAGRADRIPRIACIQSSETNAMSRAFHAGKEVLTEDEGCATSEIAALFEPTLNSTNPARNYPELRECLLASNGTITDVPPRFVDAESHRFIEALSRRGISMRFDLEKSLLIGYVGLVRLAGEQQIARHERVLLLATGRGERGPTPLMTPDATIRPSTDAPQDLLRRLRAAKE